MKLWQQTIEDTESVGDFSFTQVGDAVYFATYTPTLAPPRRTKLLRTDGTPAGTRLVKNFDEHGPLTNLIAVGGTLYFRNDNRLWKSDGTAAGTLAVADLPTATYEYANGGGTFNQTVAGDLVAGAGRVFFIGPDTYRGYELWAYDPGSAKRKMRRLPSVVPQVALSNGALTVGGLPYEDDIRLAANRRSGVLRVQWNNANPIEFRLGDVRSVVVRGGAADDRITMTGPVPRATLLGGDGNDSLAGGDGDDHLRGEAGRDQLAGGGGADNLHGGDGDDRLISEAGGDALAGGAGEDWISYEDRTANLVIRLDGRARDGQAGERDNVMPDVEKVFGGSGNDVIVGSAGDDWIMGGPGNDTLHGGGGSDVLYGFTRRDLLVGLANDDSLQGGEGRDTLDGGDGIDVLHGDDEYDWFRKEWWDDHLNGGAGIDWAVFRDGDRRDSIEKRIRI